MTFEAMWRDLAPVGRSAASGGYFRQPFTTAERELWHWFLVESARRGLEVESDELGLATIAWWRPAGDTGPGVVTGSHLDSVLDGGAYDGPLGVISAFAAIDVLRERGFTPGRPVGVAVFAEEEGSRFGLACLGSRVLTGEVDLDQLKRLQDPAGTWFLDATDGAGLHLAPDTTALTDPDRLAQIGCFVELHVEQGRDLVDRDAAVGVASGIWPHGRWRFDFTGEANHAGTTRMGDRRDPMLTFAMTVLAANKQARLVEQRATFGRVEVEPNGTNAVPSTVRAWLDARCETDAALRDLLATIEKQSVERAGRDGTSVTVTAESVSGAVSFDAALARTIAGPHGWPIIPTQAGHDAGILSAAGIPTAMLFVRNPTGVSHSPAEHAEMRDCLTGVQALADTLERLAS